MGFFRRAAPGPVLRTARLTLRPPQMGDHAAWARLRRDSEAFLTPWEPVWARDHLSARAFRERVVWAARSVAQGRAYPLFLIRDSDAAVLGAITLDNIRRGPAMSATVGYWIGQPHARRGYMREALEAVRAHVFGPLDLSRLEAACLPENAASRGLLERCGFKYEGVAQSYLQIAGRWRTHVLYAALRDDRRGRAEEG
ncbi:MAG: 30S ribosomal protein S5 alanine N-acetyltransferase [Rhodobacterales bacterium CG18_big_fil_WC_8_21_14_2_50_71_9]|nr:MAG: 30S ribosomal protein S5 alanine N-acetyltransferase [Rhodobacterales bacterium CG18_big_fil_WC_8_21_14_2_50_71_9]PIY73153.1 MAG: 30S ribosomal protein S5 alanine N-acetyltransferase [Rhodobacterales bacterium CG_4_10_14_0_8_um_filter_70_9]PJA60990.1 MAG: 30S ribosomal protein S5 alanine N-acetyltransferase [Rhodobacterales bacterium CG_4_9_14_3_um_filter_71_31]